MDVRPIEKADFPVLESSQQKRHPHITVCDVWKRCKHEPRWFELSDGVPQRNERVAQVLKNVTENHDIEGLVLDVVPDVVVVDITYDHTLGPLFGFLGRFGVKLDANDIAATIHHDLREVTGRAAHFQDGLVVADQ